MGRWESGPIEWVNIDSLRPPGDNDIGLDSMSRALPKSVKRKLPENCWPSFVSVQIARLPSMERKWALIDSPVPNWAKTPLQSGSICQSLSSPGPTSPILTFSGASEQSPILIVTKVFVLLNTWNSACGAGASSPHPIWRSSSRGREYRNLVPCHRI